METLAPAETVPPSRMRTRQHSNRLDTSSADTHTNIEMRDIPVELDKNGAAVDSKGKGSRSSTRKRKSSSTDTSQICPICGLTIRPSELENHFKYEVQQLDSIVKRGRILKDAQAAYLATKAREQDNEKRSRSTKRRKKRAEMSDSDEESSDSDSDADGRVDGQMLLLEVRANRHARERKKELLQNPAQNPDTMLCPVCFSPLVGSDVDKNRHVENCLNGQPSGSNDTTPQAGDGIVDIEGEDQVEEEEEEYETYEWAGETRIRATSMLQGGFQGLGYQTTSTRHAPDADDEEDLDVDGDETAEFGPQQYSEEDVLARCPSRSSLDTGDVGYEDNVSDDILIEGCLGSEIDQQNSSDTNTCTKHVGLPSSGIQIVVESLKAKVRELESELTNKKERLKCLICMGAYSTPLVSVQCWHVHCEDCWLTTLASKKLCPQCQMITAPSQLRRIYL